MGRNLNKTLSYKSSEHFDENKNVIIGQCDAKFLIKMLNARDDIEKAMYIASFVYDHGWDFTDLNEIKFFFDSYREEKHEYPYYSTEDYPVPISYFVDVYILKACKSEGCHLASNQL